VISSVNSIGKAVIWCWELGADTAVANSHACLLVVDISLHLSVDHHVSPVCMAAFTDFVNSGVSGGRWILTRWPCSSTLSLTLEWITVTPSWPVHQEQ